MKDERQDLTVTLFRTLGSLPIDVRIHRVYFTAVPMFTIRLNKKNCLFPEIKVLGLFTGRSMKSGCKIYTQNVILHVTVKDVATLFVPHLSNLPPVALDPAYTFLHILRCLKVASFLVPIMTKFLPHLWSYIY